MRNWLPHWYWMIDHATINAFKMAVYGPAKIWTQREHRGFRVRLYQELFAFKESGEEKKQLDKLGTKRLNPYVQHTYMRLSKSQHPCAWCSHTLSLERSRSRSPIKRQFGDEISNNIPPKARARRTPYGCSGCGVSICGVKQRDCWWQWHGQEEPEEHSADAIPD